MTIEEIFVKDEISILARNICMANKIETIRDLKLHYDKSEGFMDLLYCDEKSNDELITVYNKYKSIDTEDRAAKPVSSDKMGQNFGLEDVVTDLDKVLSITPVTHILFGKIERKLEKHWEEKGVEKTSQSVERLRDVVTDLDDVMSTTPTVDALMEETEQHQRKKFDDGASQNKNRVSSVKTIPAVTDVVDLEKIEQALKKYWNEKPATEVVDTVDLEELEQRVEDYWRKQNLEETAEEDAT